MPEHEQNGRTHEPDLREITAELDGVRQWILAELRAIREMMDERDKRYETTANAQKTAVDAAMAAQDKLTNALRDTSQKAIEKAENAQHDKNAMQNEFRGQLADMQATLIPRTEAEVRFKAQQEKIDALRIAGSENTGQRAATQEIRQQSNWSTGVIVSAVMASIASIIGIAAIFISLLRQR